MAHIYIAICTETVNKRLADGHDGNRLQLEKFRLNFSQVVFARLQKIDINGRGLFSLCELRSYLPFDVRRSNVVHGLGCQN